MPEVPQEGGNARCAVACGVAGWAYPDWEGYVYPRGTRDKLRYIAGYVDCIEVNSTFYRPPEARTVSSWVARTADLSSFFFTAKLHQDITHKGLMEAATVTAFQKGLEPAVRAGRLRHLLAQFRYDFADSPDSRRHIEMISDAFGGMANLVVEVRHISWQSPEALEFLRDAGVTVANLDYPMARNSFDMRTRGVGRDAYLRLHGRNAAAWFSKGAGRDETYNYLYSSAEVDGLVARVRDLAAMSATLTVIANNHYQGKEAVNALEIKARLTGRPLAVPQLLKERYTRLEAVEGPGQAVAKGGLNLPT
jgi:uncharacterized protein YecE (DUF72 family)